MKMAPVCAEHVWAQHPARGELPPFLKGGPGGIFRLDPHAPPAATVWQMDEILHCVTNKPVVNV